MYGRYSNFYPECPETETRRILKERSERLKERQVEVLFFRLDT